MAVIRLIPEVGIVGERDIPDWRPNPSDPFEEEARFGWVWGFADRTTQLQLQGWPIDWPLSGLGITALRSEDV